MYDLTPLASWPESGLLTLAILIQVGILLTNPIYVGVAICRGGGGC